MKENARCLYRIASFVLLGSAGPGLAITGTLMLNFVGFSTPLLYFWFFFPPPPPPPPPPGAFFGLGGGFAGGCSSC